MKTSSTSEHPSSLTPNPEETPLRQPNELSELPVPLRVERETKASHDKEDLHHGDEGIDDPPPQSDQMGD